MGSCPPEWTEEVSRNTNHCYKLRTHKETWSDAQDYCNKEQANLVSFADDTEAGFVTGQWILSLQPLKLNLLTKTSY